MAGEMLSYLVEAGIVDSASLEPFSDRVRDRTDVKVLRCRRSGVIFLDSIARNLLYYATKEGDFSHISTGIGAVPVSELEDADRRAKQFGPLIKGKQWLDFGTGRGTILDAMRLAAAAVGVEPNAACRKAANARGHHVFESLAELEGQYFDVITLFHVLEHLEDPIGVIADLKRYLAPDGRMIVEVPHARDALFDIYTSEAFKQFTLWSEHLVLHTRDSLRQVIEAAGLKCEAIDGYQRYPVSNHLYWLRHAKPGGHEAWSFLNTPELTAAYAAALARLDRTDTLVAYVRD